MFKRIGLAVALALAVILVVVYWCYRDVVIWPQNGPHRVENSDDLNISLSTEHYTAAQLRCIRVHQANSLIRTATGLGSRSVQTEGLAYSAKCATCTISATAPTCDRCKQSATGT